MPCWKIFPIMLATLQMVTGLPGSDSIQTVNCAQTEEGANQQLCKLRYESGVNVKITNIFFWHPDRWNSQVRLSCVKSSKLGFLIRSFTAIKCFQWSTRKTSFDQHVRFATPTKATGAPVTTQFLKRTHITHEGQFVVIHTIPVKLRFPHHWTVVLQTHLSKCCVHKLIACPYIFIKT